MSADRADDSRVTRITDRGGRRTRIYVRINPARPGQQERRRRAAQGEGCEEWRPAESVLRQGVCRPCANREWRAAYARDPAPIRIRVHARKRGVAPIPQIARELLLEQFDGQCAYCAAAATTWDHLTPVALGGRTEPGNVVPACASCNSSKRASLLVT
jgi:5-methylcytosine-specific restriction endonuclease McrA